MTLRGAAPCVAFVGWVKQIYISLPESRLAEADRNRDLGWMLYDIDYDRGREALFFRARLEDGVIDLVRARAEGLAQ